MKPLLFLLILVYPVFLFGQKQKSSKTPDQKELQAEMEKELKELEKEDPETAKMLRDMMKTGKPPASPVPPKKIVKQSSPLVPVNISGTFAIPTASQATDRLFWYRGKKLNDSTLVQTSGTLVQFQKKRSRLVVQPPANKDPFTGIAQEVTRLEDRKKDFLVSVSKRKNSFFFYPAIATSLTELDLINEQYREVCSNVIQIPASFTANPGFYKTGKGGGDPAYENASIPDSVKKRYDKVMEMMNHPEELDLVEPPARQLDACFNCDTVINFEFYNKYYKWKQDFTRFENDLYFKAVMVTRDLPGSDAESLKMVADMKEAMDLSIRRFRQKFEMLEEKYGDNVFVIPLLILENLSLIRQEALTGMSEEEENETVQKLQRYLDKILVYVKQQMLQRNYSVSFNLPFIIGLYRHKAILGEDENFLPDMNEHLDEFMRFNRFRMTVSMYSSIGSDDLKATALVETPQEFYVSLGMNECRYQLFIRETDYLRSDENGYYIPLLSKGGVKSQKEEDDKWVEYNYSGPVEMMAVFPAFRIDFCNNSIPDSVYWSIVRYRTNDLSSEAKKLPKAYTIDLMGYINLLIVNPDKAEESVDEELGIAKKMMAIHLTPQLPYPTGIPELDALQENYYKVLRMQEQQTDLAQVAFSNKVLFLFDAQNYAKNVIDVSSDSRSPNSQFDVQGVIKVKVVHDPLPATPAQND